MILVIYGTRPEAIKLKPVVDALSNMQIGKKLLHTGQHKESSIELTPTFSLDRQNKQGIDTSIYLADLVYSIADWIRYEEVKPRLIIVQGDTTSALAGALAAHGMGIPIAHIEAGLRTGDLDCPWPEEGNRKLIDSISSLLFAPTRDDWRNLIREGVDDFKIHQVGSTACDAVRSSMMKWGLHLGPGDQPKYGNPSDRVLVTCHRRENWDDDLHILLDTVYELAIDNPGWMFNWVFHFNPELRHRITMGWKDLPTMKWTNPLSHDYMLREIYKSKIIITDSGGLQEEAHYMWRPAIVVRKKTERHDETHRLTGMNKQEIKNAFTILSGPLGQHQYYNHHYGTGFSGHNIANVIRTWRKE